MREFSDRFVIFPHRLRFLLCPRVNAHHHEQAQRGLIQIGQREDDEVRICVRFGEGVLIEHHGEGDKVDHDRHDQQELITRIPKVKEPAFVEEPGKKEWLHIINNEKESLARPHSELDLINIVVCQFTHRHSLRELGHNLLLGVEEDGADAVRAVVLQAAAVGRFFEDGMAAGTHVLH